MYRFAIEQLKDWKNSKNRKPLVIYGARQVGKTWLMREFGLQNYGSVAYITFESDTVLKKIFESDFNIPRIINALSLASGVKITPETLIIFDEIQECPAALTSLKYFNENAREYHILAAGSLLGVKTLSGTGFPVGKVDMLTIYPMTFYEFVTAVDNRFEPLLAPNLKGKIDFKTIKTFHDTLTGLVKQYFYVGGMPAALSCYAETRDFTETQNTQRQIVDSYYADFAKHIPSLDIARTRDIWDSVPRQLAKENKRFLYSDMKAGSRGRNYETALLWLSQTNLIHRLFRVSLPNMPLAGYKEASIFKIYMNDIGLLSARLGMDPKTYIDDDDKTFSHYKGGLAEQFVLQELIASYSTVPLYYWAAEKNSAEVEFIMQWNGGIIPIEVKSGKNAKSESLSVYREKFKPEKAVRASLKQFGKTDGLYSLPLYMTGSIGNILNS